MRQPFDDSTSDVDVDLPLITLAGLVRSSTLIFDSLLAFLLSPSVHSLPGSFSTHSTCQCPHRRTCHHLWFLGRVAHLGHLLVHPATAAQVQSSTFKTSKVCLLSLLWMRLSWRPAVFPLLALQHGAKRKSNLCNISLVTHSC